MQPALDVLDPAVAPSEAESVPLPPDSDQSGAVALLPSGTAIEVARPVAAVATSSDSLPLTAAAGGLLGLIAAAHVLVRNAWTGLNLRP